MLLFLREEIVGVLSFNQIEPIIKNRTSATGLMKATRGGGCFLALQALMDACPQRDGSPLRD